LNKLIIYNDQRFLHGGDVYVGFKGFAFKTHLDLFQELSLDFISTMGPRDEPTPQLLVFVNRAFLLVAFEKFPALDFVTHASNPLLATRLHRENLSECLAHGTYHLTEAGHWRPAI
jgi:hypothetical protein